MATGLRWQVINALTEALMLQDELNEWHNVDGGEAVDKDAARKMMEKAAKAKKVGTYEAALFWKVGASHPFMGGWDV